METRNLRKERIGVVTSNKMLQAWLFCLVGLLFTFSDPLRHFDTSTPTIRLPWLCVADIDRWVSLFFLVQSKEPALWSVHRQFQCGAACDLPGLTDAWICISIHKLARPNTQPRCALQPWNQIWCIPCNSPFIRRNVLFVFYRIVFLEVIYHYVEAFCRFT